MTPQTLAAIASTVLSLLFSYVPGFKTWYQPLSPTIKRLFMLAVVMSAAAGAFGLNCAGWGDQLNLNLTCDQTGVMGLLSTLLAALAANQATFLISPKPAAKRALKRDDLDAWLDSQTAQGPGLPSSVTERYGKSKRRPGRDSEDNRAEPNPVKIRSIGEKD